MECWEFLSRVPENSGPLGELPQVRSTEADALANDPKLAKKQDDDGRYAVHWAASSNSFQIMLMLAELPGFDPDVQVRIATRVATSGEELSTAAAR